MATLTITFEVPEETLTDEQRAKYRDLIEEGIVHLLSDYPITERDKTLLSNLLGE